MTYLIKFGYPRRGLSGRFNTFRLGRSAAATLNLGEQVHLVDARSGKLLKLAIVRGIHLGPLNEMAALYARDAHNWKEHPLEQRSELLMASLSKRYFPGRVTETSLVTVLDLETVNEHDLPEP